MPGALIELACHYLQAGSSLSVYVDGIMHISGPFLEAQIINKRGCNKIQVILWLQTT